MFVRRILLLSGLVVGTVALLYGLHLRIAGGPPLHVLLDPADGMYRTARQASPSSGPTDVSVPGLVDSVTVLRDDRLVPHIFASSDRAATIALGYVAAKDRLFELDFLPRVASGRLSEVFGEQAVDADRFLRRTGMEWGAQKNLDRIRSQSGVEHKILTWYGRGVNAYLDKLDRGDLPLEFRLLGYTPDRYTPIQGLRLLQYMTFDLTYNTDDPSYAILEEALSSSEYRMLYPESPPALYEPIVPPSSQIGGGTARIEGDRRTEDAPDVDAAVHARSEGQDALRQLTGIRPHPSTGSNNWALAGSRSATGSPLLAGDMHLSLSLPSIWYEAHVVTPTMNAYGLTIPGAPVLVQAMNRNVGWTMTNTGADQIDHYALDVDSSRTRYRFEGEWRTLRTVVDTIQVQRGPDVLDTLSYSHHGPVRFSENGEAEAVAERWVGHQTSRTLKALWRMNRASDIDEVTEALQDWDTPMQNVLYAGRDESIAIRSVGYLPVRRAGDGRGLLDGTTARGAWIGRVPFDSLPASNDPSQGYLASANQVPTGAEYPYYMGHDWGDGYRSLRINELLRGKEAHGLKDVKAYQADVQVQQRDVFVPFLRSLDGLSERADSVRGMLRAWEGTASVDRPEPLVMDEFLRQLRRSTWDEPVFDGAPEPSDAVLVHLLRTQSSSHWLDIQSTDTTEDAQALLVHTLEAVADTMASEYGWDPDEWRWGDHHMLRINHLAGIEAFGPLGRGPFEFPGFDATILPGRGRSVTHSASQRVIIDFSTSPPTGHGVYPGGQSGRPLNPEFYDQQVGPYLEHEYFEYRMPSDPSEMEEDAIQSILVLTPRRSGT